MLGYFDYYKVFGVLTALPNRQIYFQAHVMLCTYIELGEGIRVIYYQNW